ncbi:Flp family type IVb pilin [Photobacterium leiognathi]|uniref:Flp family type IVb pilin n=1 Tax=Photobacterium leiognathi TaxID=553611 RepID=UPI0029828A73|nr:Flp family type IVb pilin [Photobacterium leiognathi]
MNAMRAFFAKFQKDERGVTAIEYGLIAIAMATVVTVVFTQDGGITDKIVKGYSTVGSQLSTISSSVSSAASTTK